MPSPYVSERDFVASRILPRFKEASRVIGAADLLDFHVEKRIDGIADLTAEKGGKGLFVLEAKFKQLKGGVYYDIEPRDPLVVKQAVNYAALGGFLYYLTCNAKRIVLFQFRPGTKAYESEIASYEYEAQPNWAEDILRVTLGLIRARLKPLDDTLVDIIREAFNDIYPEIFTSLKERLKDRRFREKYLDWLESQGIEPSDENTRLIAEQSTYLQINKLLFYQVIRVIYPEKLSPLRVEEHENVTDALNRLYAGARAIDYAPVYESDMISEIPLTTRVNERLRTLIDTLNEFDFSRMESDFLGKVYEKLISPYERKRLGQFYTPPGIVDFIVELSVKSGDARVLDPSCGSGSFLVKAYNKLRELNGIQKDASGALGELLHRQILGQLYGVDINQFPAHLSVINLAIQNTRARIEKLNVIVGDFFDIMAGQATLSGFSSITTHGKQTLVDFPASFDVVVANPPYVRQELLGAKEKDKIKELIEAEYKERVYIGVPKKQLKNIIPLDKQSDIYIYFFIHGISLLKNGGSLGFISSNKWLEVEYGEPFQDFLVNYTRIKYVVEFDRAIFPDADINTAITVVDREKDEQNRSDNLVKFVRFKKRVDLRTQLELVQETKQSYEDERVNINVVRQGELKSGKWNTYLRAPLIFQTILRNPTVRALGSIAEIFRGPVTGYNDYFILPEEKVKEWHIEHEFLKPCISSPKKVRGLSVHKKEVKEYFLMANQPKTELAGTNALKYVEYGEQLEIDVRRGSERGRRRLPELQTVSNRQPWYALPQPKEAPILFQYLIDEKPRAFWNIARAHAPNIIHYIVPCKGEYVLPILGYLNSSVNALMVELFGRSYGGGVLKVEVYELKDLPVIDIASLSDVEKSRLSDAFKMLVEATDERIMAEDEVSSVESKSKDEWGLFEKGVQETLKSALKKEEGAQSRLDDVVFDILRLDEIERGQVLRGVHELRNIRRLRTRTFQVS